MKVFLINLLFTSMLFSAPTPEGLFRNGANKKVSGNFVYFQFEAVQKIEIEDIVENQETEFLGKRLVEWIFELGENDLISLLQITYRVSNGEREFEDIKRIKNLENYLLSSKKIESKIYYSLMLMYVLNSSTSISHILKGLDKKFLYNEEVINKEKKDLLEKYKNYLIEKKKVVVDESLKSPLVSEEPQENQNIKKY